MLCDVCKDGLEGMWDPSRSTRLALLKDFMDDKGDYDFEGNSGGSYSTALQGGPYKSKQEHFLWRL